MKIKKLIYGICVIVACIGMHGCLEQSFVVDNYVNEPAIARYDGGQKQIETMYGLFSIPSGFDSGSISEADFLITYFNVNSSSQPPSTIYPEISDFKYIKLHSNVVKITSQMTDSYKDSIVSVSLYHNFVDSVLFFNITQKIGKDQGVGYEMICNPDSDSITTTGTIIKRLFIKSLRLGGQQQEKDTIATFSHAFEMNEFVNQFTDINKDSILFNVKYLSGSKNGKDIYKTTNDSTLVWVLGRTPGSKKIYSLEKSKSSK